MEKNKIITSLTLAGILTAGVLGGNANAASNKSQGVCKDLIKGESLVPYIFDSSADKLLAEAIKGEYRVTGENFKDSAQVRTGDKFETAKGKKTVLVYGDVNKDGVVDTFDASATQQIYLGRTATDLERTAANVLNNDGTVDTFDASRIQQFYLGNEKLLVANPPKGEVEEYNDEYTVAIDAGKGVNNQNYEKIKMTVTPKEALEKDVTLKLEVTKKDPNDGTFKSSTNTIIDKTPNDQTDKTTAANYTDEITLAKNIRNVEVTLDFSKLISAEADNGTYKLTLKNADDEIVAEKEITTHYLINTTSQITANVFVKRSNSYGAQVGLMAWGTKDVKIDNMYCSISTGASTASDFIKEKGTVKLSVTNNEIVPSKLINDSNNKLNDSSAKVYYVLEDSYGNLIHLNTTGATVVDDAIDATIAPEANVEKIVPNEDKEFVITLDDDGVTKVVAVLYEDGKPIFKDEFAPSSATSKTVTTSGFAAKMNKGANYTVKAYVKATSAKNPSEVKASNSGVAMTQLPAVNANSIAYDAKNDRLVWDYSRNDVVYSVEIKDPTVTTTPTPTPVVAYQNKIDNPALRDNKGYKVTVSADLEKEDPNVIASEKTEKELYKLNLADLNGDGTADQTMIADYTDTTVQLKTITPITLPLIEGGNAKLERFEYRLEVWDSKEEGDVHTERNCIKNQKVVLTKTKGLNTYETPVITGLTPGEYYTVKLFAIYDGNESVSANRSFTTSNADMKIDYTVDKNINKPTAGKIRVNGSKVYADLKEYNKADYTKSVQNILDNVVANLSTGDHVTVNGNNVTINVGTENQDTTTFGSIEGLNITIIGNKSNRTINGAALAASYKDATLTLQGGLFTIGNNLTDTNIETIVLDGTEIRDLATTSKTFTYAAGKTNRVNDVDIKAGTNPITIKNVSTVSATKFEIIPSNSAVEVNADYATQPVEVNFKGDTSTSQTQSGNIVVNSNNGKNVTLTATKANITGNVTATMKSISTSTPVVLTLSTANSANYVSGNITANIENGTINVSDATLTGSKSINVTNVKNEDGTRTDTTTITATLKDEPLFTTSAAVSLNAIKYNEDTKAFTDGNTAITNGTDVTDEQVMNFIKSLGIDKKANASITVTPVAGSNGKVATITLTFTGNVTNYTGLNGIIK